jgi:hypothetical protein
MSNGGHVDDGDGDGGGGLELTVGFRRFSYGNFSIIVGFLGTVFFSSGVPTWVFTSSGPHKVTMANCVVPVNPFEVC